MNRADSIKIIELMKKLISILKEKNRRYPNEDRLSKIHELEEWINDREEEVEEHGGIQ